MSKPGCPSRQGEKSQDDSKASELDVTHGQGNGQPGQKSPRGKGLQNERSLGYAESELCAAQAASTQKLKGHVFPWSLI